MTTATSQHTATVRAIREAICTDDYGVPTPFKYAPTDNNWGGHDYHGPDGVTVRVTDDDGTIHVRQFTHGRSMLLLAEASMTNMPVRLIAATVVGLLS